MTMFSRVLYTSERGLGALSSRLILTRDGGLQYSSCFYLSLGVWLHLVTVLSTAVKTSQYR